MAGFLPERHISARLGPAAIVELSQALDECCATDGVPDHTAWRLKVAVDEILTNIVSHGSDGREGAAIDVWFACDDGTVEVRIADDGVPFDPLAQPAPDVNAPLETRQPGGLGIALIKGLIDEVTYQRTTRNVLTLRVHLSARPDTSTRSRT